MRVLHIVGSELPSMDGGYACVMRNYAVINSVFGEKNIDKVVIEHYPGNTIWQKAKKIFVKMFLKRDFKNPLKYVENINQYDFIYVDNAVYGLVLKDLKRMNFKGKSIVFFHNCEYDYYKLTLKNKHFFSRFLMISLIKAAERSCLENADCCVFINERDYKREQIQYGIKAKNWIVDGMTMVDKLVFSEEQINSMSTDEPIYTIMGSYCIPNTQGILWFLRNVYPYVKIKLRIVGKDMEKLKNDIDCTGFEIYSSVPDLEPYLLESDYMILPVFEGSGMKIKTCESLMYAKNIIGTPETFSGYGIEDYGKIGACCSTPDEFINAIKNLKLPRYNRASRELFLNNFVFQCSITRYKNMLQMLNN